MFKSLKSKIFAAQLGIALLVSLSIGTTGYHFMLDSLTASEQNRMEFIASLTAHEIKDFFNYKKTLVRRITESREFEDYPKFYRNLALAKHFAKYKDEIPYLSYVNIEGLEEVKTVDGKISDRLENYSSEPCFRNAMASPNRVIVIGPDDAGHSEGLVKLSLTKRLYFGDEISGTLIGHIPLSKLSQMVARIRVGRTGYIAVINDKGTIMSHPHTDKVLTKIAGQGEKSGYLIRSATGMQTGFVRARVMGVDGLIAYTPLKDMKWSVMAIMPYEEFISAPKKLGTVITLVTILIFGISFLVSLSLTRHLTKPLEKMVAASNRVAGGNLSQIVNISTKDTEISALVDSYNKMLARLSETLISRDHVENILRSMNDSLVIVDGGGRIKTVNAATLDILGYGKEELVGMHAALLFGEDADEAYLCRLLDQFPGNQNKENLEVIFASKTGKKIPFMISGAALSDQGGTSSEYVIVGKDITDIKETENHLRSLVSKLEESNRELQDFAHIASHDLQEPLRKVMAFADRVKAGYSDVIDEKGRDYLDRMHNAAHRMQHLINGLLTYSRVTTRAKPFEPVNLSNVVHEALSDLEDRIRETHGQITVDQLPTVSVDPFQMKQLFENLIGNSLKFTSKDRPPDVKISARLCAGNADGMEDAGTGSEQYEICVEDNGIGFDEKYKDRIFSVFQRLHGRNEYEGAGIGLSVCKKIVDRHGGSITAKSAPGRGASFIFTLPIIQGNGGNDG